MNCWAVTSTTTASAGGAASKYSFQTGMPIASTPPSATATTTRPRTPDSSHSVFRLASRDETRVLRAARQMSTPRTM